MNHFAKQTIETLRFSARDKARLLGALRTARERSGHRPDFHQRSLRVALPIETEVVLSLLSDSGYSGRFSVLPWNLSRHGLGLVHGRFIYPGTRCEIEITGRDGRNHIIPGSIVYCQHMQGLIHELGVQFEAPIVLTDFVDLRPEEEAQLMDELAEHPDAACEAKQPSAGHVLIIDDFTCDRKLLSHWLGKERMVTSTLSAYDQQSMLGAIQEEWFDLLIVDMHLGTQNGADIISMLRGSNVLSPILAISADEDTETRYKALRAGANAFLQKPFTKEQLITAVHQLMDIQPGRSSEPIISTASSDPEMKPLLIEFMRNLPESVDQLRKANNRGDYEKLEQICYSLKGTGCGYGFPAISEHASAVLRSLNESIADVNQIKHEVTELVNVLKRVRPC